MHKNRIIQRHLPRMNEINRRVVENWETLRNRFQFRARHFPNFKKLLYGKISDYTCNSDLISATNSRHTD